MANIVQRECTLIMVGKTGSGMSSLGNSLLFTGRDYNRFKTGNSAYTTTVHCCRSRSLLADGTLLTVVDTPGLFHPNKPNDDTVKEIVKALAICAPGPHVILFVLSLRRFTPEEADTVKILKSLFGKEAMKHVIVVFTGKDAFDDDDDDDDVADVRTVDEYVEKSPTSLKSLLQECNSRYVGIANKLKSPTHNSDVKDVMNLIYKTMEQNNYQAFWRAG